MIDRIDERDSLAALTAVEGGGAAGLQRVDEILQLAAVAFRADRLGVARAGAKRVRAARADRVVLGFGVTESPLGDAIVLERNRAVLAAQFDASGPTRPQRRAGFDRAERA